MVKGFHTIWCQTANMEGSIAFYRDVLGLVPGFTSDQWSEFKLSNGTLALHATLDGAEAPLGIYKKGWFVGLETDSIRELREKLEAAGAKIHGDYHDVPSGVILDFEDPDGNTLEAYQAGITVAQLL